MGALEGGMWYVKRVAKTGAFLRLEAFGGYEISYFVIIILFLLICWLKCHEFGLFGLGI